MSTTDPAPQEPGRPAGASGVAAERDLRPDIEAALKPRARLLRLPTELEQRYHAVTARGRNRSLRTWLYLLALIDFLCIGIDALVMPEHIMEAAIARGLVLTPIYLGAAALLYRQRPPWVQGLSILVPTCSIMLVAGYLAELAGGIHVERYLLGGLFTVFASTVVPNVALRWAAAQAAISLAIFGALLFRLNTIDGALPLLDNIELLTFFPVSIVAALHVRNWIERMHRRNFLMALRDELRVQELALSKARRDAALANMSQGIIMREPSGLIPIINRRAIELLGMPESFLDGPLYNSDILRLQRDREEFKDPSLPAGVIARLQHGDESNVPMVYERKRPDGTVLEVRSTMLGDGGMVRTYTDITERKRSETALAAARDAAEAASRARSEFLAMMSHEIRTPMNAVLGLTGSLLESKLDPDQRKAAEAIQEASDGLLSILNDILDLSKLDTGKLEFEQVPFSIESVIDNTKSIVALRAVEKGLKLRLDLATDLPKALIGDPSRVRQILLNLASNAVKFTPAGNVVISAHCVARDAESATVRIAVKDSGIGIAPDRLGRPRSTGSTAARDSASPSASGWSIRWAARSRSNPRRAAARPFRSR
jgi:signal transduction histidine kinase